MDNVVIHIEDDIGLQPTKLALESEEIVSQRENGDRVAEATKRFADVPDLRHQIGRARTILGQLRRVLRVRVIDQCDVQSLLHGLLSVQEPGRRLRVANLFDPSFTRQHAENDPSIHLKPTLRESLEKATETAAWLSPCRLLNGSAKQLGYLPGILSC